MREKYEDYMKRRLREEDEKYKQFIIENKTFIFKNNSSYPIDINNNLDLKIAEVVMSNEK